MKQLVQMMLTTKLQIADDKLTELIYNKLKDFSEKIVGSADTSDWHSYTVTSEDEKIVAGSVFRMLYGQLHIRYLAVDEEYRAQKLGSMLMEKTIAWGKEHGCTIAHVETLSFQALGFYLKLGFTLEYTKIGYSKGIKLHFLRKDI